MIGITIFMEGGGDSVATRAALRQGMDTFLQPLKQAARDKGWYWNLVCRGPRGEAFRQPMLDALVKLHGHGIRTWFSDKDAQMRGRAIKQTRRGCESTREVEAG